MENNSNISLGGTIKEKNTVSKYKCERQRIIGYSCLSAQNKASRRGWGGNRLDHRYHTPLYEKSIKKIENKSMETTVLAVLSKEISLRIALYAHNSTVHRGLSVLLNTVDTQMFGF